MAAHTVPFGGKSLNNHLCTYSFTHSSNTYNHLLLHVLTKGLEWVALEHITERLVLTNTVYSLPFEWTWEDLYPISIPGCFECRSNWGPRWHVRKIDGPTVSGQLDTLARESSCKYWIPTRDKLETSFTYLARTCTFSQGKVLNTWPWVPRNKYHYLRSLCNFVVIYSSSIVWLLKPVM